MNAAQFTAFALALAADIQRDFHPTPEAFEDLQFHAQEGRVVILGDDRPGFDGMLIRSFTEFNPLQIGSGSQTAPIPRRRGVAGGDNQGQ